MKSIQDYVNEAFIKAKDLNNVHTKGTVTILWPVDENATRFKNIKLENVDKFVIYRDPYHDRKHIAYYNDFIFSMLLNSFEDMSPDTIIAGFPTLLEAVKYALEDNPNEYYDSKDFMENVLDYPKNVEDNCIDDYGLDIKNFKPTKKSIIDTFQEYH